MSLLKDDSLISMEENKDKEMIEKLETFADTSNKYKNEMINDKLNKKNNYRHPFDFNKINSQDDEIQLNKTVLSKNIQN